MQAVLRLREPLPPGARHRCSGLCSHIQPCWVNRENQGKGIFLGREAEDLKCPLLADVALRCLVWYVAGCQAPLTPSAGAFVP